MRSRIPGLVGLLAITLCATLVLQAKRSMTTVLDVAPNPVHSGEPLAVTSTLTNNTNAIQSVTVSVETRGPCGVMASRTYKLLLNPHQSDSSKASFQTPTCAGGYQAVLTVSDDGNSALLGETTRTFEVVKQVSSAATGR